MWGDAIRAARVRVSEISPWGKTYFLQSMGETWLGVNSSNADV